MKLKLTDDEQAVLLPHIQEVLNTGRPWEDKHLHHPAGAIIDAVLSLDGVKRKELDENDETGENDEGFSTNGWQWDWWQHFTYRGKSYTLSGSGYHGGHAFHLSDEQ